MTDEAVKARYDAEFAGKKGEEEVHARHILVADEATAKKIIAELKKGGDFAALSKQYSKDPGAAQQGGDLGFFKTTDMVPEFADAAFALKDKEVSADAGAYPVRLACDPDAGSSDRGRRPASIRRRTSCASR